MSCYGVNSTGFLNKHSVRDCVDSGSHCVGSSPLSDEFGAQARTRCRHDQHDLVVNFEGDIFLFEVIVLFHLSGPFVFVFVEPIVGFTKG